MISWNELRLRLRALFQRRRFERDVEDEIAFHVGMREQALREQGTDANLARSAARAQFGNVTQAGEGLREMRGWGWMEGVWQDVRFALRQMRLHRGFTVATILPLALAIGCIAAVFSLVDAVLYRPTGVAEPGRVAAVYTFSRTLNRYLSDSYPDFRDIQALDGIVDSAAAYIAGQFNNVRLTGGMESMAADMVTGDYFRAAGIQPALGRPLTPDDDRPGATPVALASYALWENRFQRSPSILGSTVSIGGVSFQIVGVMPKGYQGMLLDWYSDSTFWFPLTHFKRVANATLDYENHREAQMLMMLVRLRPGVSVQRFQAALDVLASRVAAQPDYRFVALPASQARFWPAYRPATVRFLWLLITVSATAMAIACFNLASLLLARAAARQKEIEARLALGAGRLRLVLQFLIENVVLAGCACVVSVPVAIILMAWFPGVEITHGFTMAVKLSGDWRALGLGMVAGLMTSALAGVIPALKATIGDSIRRRTSGRTTLQDFFSMAQVACAMAALAGAALLGENIRHLKAAPMGYESRGVLVASMDLSNGLNPSRDAAEKMARDLLAEIRAQAPGAALAWHVLPSRFQSMLDVQREGDGKRTPILIDWISDGYFESLRMPVISGRGIIPADDRRSQPVVVVNRSAAALFWPGESPIGRRLYFQFEKITRQVVGVVEDARYRPLGEEQPALPYLFLPMFQSATALPFEVQVRTPAEPLAFTLSLRQIVARVNPNAPLYNVGRLDDFAQAGLMQMRVASQAAGAVSALGVMLAVAGIFASGAYRVARQKKEIAIRIAIGAEPTRVIRSFAARGLWIGMAGACLGVVPAIWGAALLRSSIPGVEAAGFPLYAGTGLVLVTAAAVAALAAARRIARVDPADVLRVQ